MQSTLSASERRLARLVPTTPPSGEQPAAARPRVDLFYLDEATPDLVEGEPRE